MTKHRQHGNDNGQWQCPPEAMLKINQFSVFFIVQRWHQRFKSHAAYRAASRRRLLDLRMHRTGVNHSFRLAQPGLRDHWSTVGLRVSAKPVHTLCAAEVIGLTCVLHFLLLISRNLHAAYRVRKWLGRIVSGRMVKVCLLQMRRGVIHE